MWHEAKKQEKKLTATMVDLKARAERRAKYYRSKLADPTQLLRIGGTACRLYPDAGQHFYHENQDNLVRWQGDGETRIDRFDGRQLLDFLPADIPSHQQYSGEQGVDEEEEEALNFERYRDVIDIERTAKTEVQVLQRIDDEWNELLARSGNRGDVSGRSAQPAAVPEKPRGAAIGYSYGGKIIESDNEDDEGASAGDGAGTEPGEEPGPSDPPSLINRENLMEVLEYLEDNEVDALNKLAVDYGISDLYRCLYVAKRTQESQDNAKTPGTSTRHKGRSDKPPLGRHAHEAEISMLQGSGTGHGSRRRRASPSYAPYGRSGSPPFAGRRDRAASEEPEDGAIEYITEFGTDSDADTVKTFTSDAQAPWAEDRDLSVVGSSAIKKARPASKQPAAPDPPAAQKRLTPLERLKLKAQMALQTQIHADESRKVQKSEDERLLKRGLRDKVVPIKNDATSAALNAKSFSNNFAAAPRLHSEIAHLLQATSADHYRLKKPQAAARRVRRVRLPIAVDAVNRPRPPDQGHGRARRPASVPGPALHLATAAGLAPRLAAAAGREAAAASARRLHDRDRQGLIGGRCRTGAAFLGKQEPAARAHGPRTTVSGTNDRGGVTRTLDLRREGVAAGKSGGRGQDRGRCLRGGGTGGLKVRRESGIEVTNMTLDRVAGNIAEGGCGPAATMVE
ncbi:hypothetical protein HDU87_000418 [Geranomyces variabilis]|uniref:Suppressor of white apricot N-terminal domain-containing protein n=1 Tax=Geranomyces variabilis TaxID=109894 RepID=A0AAD5XUD4_9FUNG|nr:hypothetical protein HDU87_000418 [Geranomyces variabilis]